MNYGSSSYSSGARTATRRAEFGRTHVVRPKGRHQATIVWLHGIGDNGASSCKDSYSIKSIVGGTATVNMTKKDSAVISCSQVLDSLPLPNIKWICPTAPTRAVAAFGGFPCTAWFDARDLSEDGSDDVEGVDASAAHVANLLSAEPPDVKLGIGGFSMGAATALYSAACYAQGKFGNGTAYPIRLSAIVGLSGWLPCSRFLKSKIESSHGGTRRAAALPLLLCHGKADDVVLYKHGERSAEILRSTGFSNLTFKTYNGLAHYTVPEEMDNVCKWMTAFLGLDRLHNS